MLWATVPETAIHEKGQPAAPKKKIRLAEYILVSAPAGDVVQAKQPHQGKLRVLIAVPANSGHDSGAFCLGKDIRHGRIPTRARPTHTAAGSLLAWGDLSGRRGRTT